MMAQAHETADILIIGAGASGGAAAWRLSEAGFRIVCLEQGRWQNPESFPPLRADWELRARSDWAFDPNLRRLSEDYPVNDVDSDISPLMFNAVGGSTIHWTGHAPRFHPSDFRVKTQDGVADDWPITYEDLAPYYELNDIMMGCSGIAGDPANPPRDPRPMPPVPVGPDGERIARAFDRLGWHWWPSDNYLNSIEYRGRLACNGCGPNGLGCARKAKGSTDVTYWPLAVAKGVDLRTSCRVYEITTGEDGRVTGASYFDADGNRQHQPARAVIMACNGIGTPRMLLLSKSDRHPAGLANSSGLVGRNLMFHPYAIVSGFFEDDTIRTWRGPLGNMIMSQEFYETDRRHDFVRGYTFQMVRSSGPAVTANGLMTQGVPWGEDHHTEFRERFGRSTSVAIIGEDLPELHNSVTLDPKLTDGSGVPAPRVRYKTSANSRKLLDHGMRNATKVLEEAGAHRIIANPLLRGGGWHLMGTARMGDDPARSVVNACGQAHDADNLFIIDGSLFVTGASVNPTTTIQALALRTSDYIVRDRQDLKG